MMDPIIGKEVNMPTTFFVMCGVIVTLIVAILVLHIKKKMSKKDLQEPEIIVEKEKIKIYGVEYDADTYRELILSMLGYLITCPDKHIDIKELVLPEYIGDIASTSKLLNDLNHFPLTECTYDENTNCIVIDKDKTAEKYNKYKDMEYIPKLFEFFM